MATDKTLSDFMKTWFASASRAVTATVNNATIGGSATQTGSSMTKVVSAATTNATVVKASAGRVFGFHFTNTGAAVRFVKFYNKATAPTVGTDTPVMVVGIPSGQSIRRDMLPPAAFATGIGIAIVTGAADADATAVGADEVTGTIQWL